MEKNIIWFPIWKLVFEPIMAVRYLAVSAAAVYCIDIGIDCPIIAMVKFQYPKLWCAVNKWFETLECATGSSQLVPSSELSKWSVQDLANSVLIKLRQSAECESLIEASRLWILKNKPIHILAFKFMSLLFWCYLAPPSLIVILLIVLYARY